LHQAAYALHHRCRVMLTQQWARDLQPQRVTVNCVHPGWVDTPGLQTAPPMQAFYKCVCVETLGDRARPSVGGDKRTSYDVNCF
jgi:NAD(P)-dependent dehydrogenase (short-subunit alcohol dehydrogenase family)